MACALIAAGSAAAQSGATFSAGGKTVDLLRADAMPAIDGRLDEDVWSRATLIDDLHQVDPTEYAEPSQRTEVRIFYGDDALYVAARLWDTEADTITAQVLRQGEGLANEDRFAVIIDPYLDRRNGYRFQVNPNGVRWEALYQNTTQLESNWQGIWQGAATRDADGWTAEMRIPFKTLSFNPATASWGINFERTIQRRGETIGWVSRNRQMNPGVAGTATGLTGLQQGVGLDVVPSMTVRGARDFRPGGGSDSALEPSLDVFYKLTTSLNAALTLNTDFSATEIDDRQVNLTRFSLFFPEKRDFFLQDADIFEFGRIGGGSNNPAMPNAAAQNARPFFSRQIGLSGSGTPVDIDYGAKLSGRAGRLNVGTLLIRQDEFQDVGATDVFVGRLSANVLSESAIGLIVTDGDPRSNLDNSLLGADFRYRNSRMPGGRELEGQAWYQQTDTPGLAGDDRAFGAGISSPNNTGLRGGFSARQVEDNFRPAVGFVNRAGIRDYALDVGYRARFDDRYLRTVYGSFDAYRAERLDTGEVSSQEHGFRINAQNNTRDGMFFRAIMNRERLLEGFAIHVPTDGAEAVVIPAGDYRYRSYRLGFDSGEQRPVALRIVFGSGEFYDGTRFDRSVEVNWRPTAGFRLGVDYSVDEIRLPGGDFDVRLTTLRAQLAFSATLSWVNLVQYDNVTETVGINSRLHWIPEAGREGFVVLNHNLVDMDRNDSFHSIGADLAIRFSHTWRF